MGETKAWIEYKKRMGEGEKANKHLKEPLRKYHDCLVGVKIDDLNKLLKQDEDTLKEELESAIALTQEPKIVTKVA